LSGPKTAHHINFNRDIDMGSSQPLAPLVMFDDAAVRIIGEAFDAACKELPYVERPEFIGESMARKIIGAAASGERDVLRLRDAALSVLKSVLH
jgi:hypothetical protein